MVKNIPSKKYQLWLKWKNINKSSNLIELINPFFDGPVCTDCEELPKDGKIILDFTNQFLIKLPKPYIVELKWYNKKSQSTEKIEFEKITMKDSVLNVLGALKNTDKILIDCKGHHSDDIEKGNFKVNYMSYIFNEAGEQYK